MSRWHLSRAHGNGAAGDGLAHAAFTVGAVTGQAGAVVDVLAARHQLVHGEGLLHQRLDLRGLGLLVGQPLVVLVALTTTLTTTGMKPWSLPHSSAHWPR